MHDQTLTMAGDKVVEVWVQTWLAERTLAISKKTEACLLLLPLHSIVLHRGPELGKTLCLESLLWQQYACLFWLHHLSSRGLSKGET